ncbi:MAG TPA: hypothetical protein VGE06_03135 [Flavisolibacter sp.]
MPRVSDLELAKKLTMLAQSAQTRRIPFNLSLGKLRQLMERKTCYFTGTPFDEDVTSPNHRSIDRIDSTGGYTDDNVCACTVQINRLKANLSFEQIGFIYKGMERHRRRA